MARVFISHASEDHALADEVHRWLVDAGHDVFLDQDLQQGIAPGEEWDQQLHERLRWANAVVCLVTSAYLKSTWCAAEIGAARSRGSQLLPLCAERGVVHPLLISLQYVGYTADPLTARAAVLKVLYQVDVNWPEDRSPFPGLRPFDTDRHRVFFGRAEEVGQLAELLRSPAERAEGAVLLVVGPSGCGKSSLVRAGLAPVLAGEPGWRILPPILPGADPVAALARELAAAARLVGLDWTVEHVHHQLTQRGLTALADELLLADPAGPQQRLLIVVDQFEELLTQSSPTERARFTELLRPALTGPVRVVATLRPEFLDQLLVDSELATLPTRTYTLRPLRREALRAVIERPARLAGIDVDEHLVDRLVDDTDSGEALPLLAFTLAQLAEGVTHGGRLSSARYDQLGGVQGALSHQADAALAEAIEAGGRSRDQVIAGLLRLVTVDEHGRPTRWRVNRTELPDHVVAELDAFVARRLLTTDSDNGTVVIGVAHEAFLSAWPPLAQAITVAASALRARRAVEHAATQWSHNGCPPARLWGGGQLAAAVTDTGARIRTGMATAHADPKRGRSRWLPQRRRVLVTDNVDLSPKARDFLHASIRHDRARRRRTITVLSVLLILALTAAGIAVVQQDRALEGQRLAQEHQRIATARQLMTQADAAGDTDPHTALQLGLAAQRIYPGGETYASLVNTLITTRYAGTLIGHNDRVESVAFSPDGRTLAMGKFDNTVILWDFTDPARPRRLGEPLTGHNSWVESVAFSPGRTLATGSFDDTVILWDLTDPARPRRLGEPLTGHTDSVNSVAFAPDGRTLATGSSDGTVMLWDLMDPVQPGRLGQPLTGHNDIGGVKSVAFSPDGKTLVGVDGTAVLWDLTDPTRPHRLSQLEIGDSLSSVTSLAFSPEGATVATGDYDGSVILWDVTDPAQPRRLSEPLTGHTDSVNSVAFAPDGRTLATGSSDGTVMLWDLTDPVQPGRLGQPLMTGHNDWVESVVFSPEGKTLVSVDGTAVLWDLTDPARLRHLGHPWPTVSVDSEALPGAHRFTGAFPNPKYRRTMLLWDLTDPAQAHRIGHPPSHSLRMVFVAFAPDRRMLATGGIEGVILWDLTDLAQPGRVGQPLIIHNRVEDEFRSVQDLSTLAFSPDERTLVTRGDNNRGVILWDLTDPEQPTRLAQLPTGHTGGLSSVAFSPDGRTLATGGDSVASLWDLTDPARPHLRGQLLNDDNGLVKSVAFSPDGRTLATGNSGAAILWDLTDPVRPHRLGQPLSHASNVHSVVFSPDGRTLATGSLDGTVILWDLTDPVRHRQLSQAHVGGSWERSVAFSPDGRTLATDGDTTILWDLTSLNHLRVNAVERACLITSGGLDRDEWASLIQGLPYQDTCPT